MTSSKPNHLPKAPLPNTITLGEASTYELWGNNIFSLQHLTSLIFLPVPLLKLTRGEQGSVGDGQEPSLWS